MTQPDQAYFDQLHDYYANVVNVYASSYTGEGRYRSNWFRLKILVHLLGNLTEKPERLLEAGCGDARVLLALLQAGYDVRGFDVSEAMLDAGKTILTQAGHDASRIELGNIYDIKAAEGSLDALISVGVIENLPDHASIFAQFKKALRPSGRLFISLNNDLFSLFSMNKHSLGFLNTLFQDVGLDAAVRNDALEEFAKWYNVDSATVVKKVFEDSEIDKSAVSLDSYNPLNVEERLRKLGFELEELRFFHYHPLPPRFEAKYPDLFRKFAETLETTDYDWRGGIVCNCMMIQARAIA